MCYLVIPTGKVDPTRRMRNVPLKQESPTAQAPALAKNLMVGRTEDGIVVGRALAGGPDFFRLSPDGTWSHAAQRRPWSPIDPSLVPPDVVRAAVSHRCRKG
jgi:hypothetical protein